MSTRPGHVEKAVRATKSAMGSCQSSKWVMNVCALDEHCGLCQHLDMLTEGPFACAQPSIKPAFELSST
jgi:hypothetical protein